MPRPQDYTFSVDISYEDDPADENRQARLQVQYQRQSWREYIASLLSSVWSTLRWTITLGGTIAAAGTEQLEFGMGDAILNDDRLIPSLELDGESEFFKTILKCRRSKKPMLMLVIQNPDDESQVDLVIQSLIENSPMSFEMIKSKYVLFVVS